jgi:helix-turn-helix protein
MPEYYIRKDIEQALGRLGFQRNPKSRKSFGEFGQQYYYEKVEKSIDDWKNSSEEEKNLKIAELEVKKGEYGLDEFEKELLTALYDSILPF